MDNNTKKLIQKTLSGQSEAYIIKCSLKTPRS